MEIEIVSPEDRKEVALDGVKFELAPLKAKDAQLLLAKSLQALQTTNAEEKNALNMEVNELLIKKSLKKLEVDGSIKIRENGELKEFNLEFDNNDTLTDYSYEVVLKLNFSPNIIASSYKYFQECNNIEDVNKGVKKKKVTKKTRKKKKA